MTDASRVVDAVVDKLADDLIDFRRDLHQHPELSWTERRTTELAAAQVADAGWRVTRTGDSGLIAELGDEGPLVALRADLDALPVDDTTGDPWASPTPGVAHACGHDVHTTALVGAAHALAEVHAQSLLRGRVRLLFQPAEEVMPGGALDLMAAGALEGVDRIFSLHCDPTVDVGQVGLREGPLTGAADRIEVHPDGCRRPHLPAAPDPGRHLRPGQGDHRGAGDPLAPPRPARRRERGVGRGRRSGSAHNVIPSQGMVGGTVRMLDQVAWAEAEGLARQAIEQVVAPYGVTRRGRLPPRRASRGQRRGLHPAARRRGGAGAGRRRAGSRPPRAWGARTSAGTSPRSPARWPGSAPGRRVARRTTCTRGTCASTRLLQGWGHDFWQKLPLARSRSLRGPVTAR